MDNITSSGVDIIYIAIYNALILHSIDATVLELTN